MEKMICETKAWNLIAQLQDGRWVGYYRSGIKNKPHKKHTLEWSEALSSHIRFHLLHRRFEGGGINILIHCGFDLKVFSEAVRAELGKDERVMSQSQAAAEQVLHNHNRKQQQVDITLGMTKKQMDDSDKDIAAIAKGDKECNQDYSFKEGHSINPGEGCKYNGTVVTSAMKVTLGNTAYNIVEGEEELSLSELAEELYEYDKGMGRTHFKMEQIHHDTGRAIVNASLLEEGGA
jgi:hypothetical protein